MEKFKVSFFNRREGRFSLLDISWKGRNRDFYVYICLKIRLEMLRIIDVYDFDIDEVEFEEDLFFTKWEMIKVKRRMKILNQKFGK